MSNYKEIYEEKYINFKNNIMKNPPISHPTNLKVGDIVTYTNEYGVEFKNREIIGFCEQPYKNAGTVHLNTSSYWFPVKNESLKIEKE